MSEANILDTILEGLGYARQPIYEAHDKTLSKFVYNFDPAIITHINSVFSTLSQLGVGPSEGFSIDPSVQSKWSDFVGDDKTLLMVQSYMIAKVRLLFDPPQNSFGISALEKMCSEYEWRLNVQAENRKDDNVIFRP